MSRALTLSLLLLLVFATLAVAQEGPGEVSPPPEPAATPQGGLAWIAGVNLVIWSGIFIYLLSLHGKIRALEDRS